MFRSGLALVGVLAVALSGGPLLAADETLSFRLVVRDIGSDTLNNPNEGGPGLAATRSVGVATFDDGRLAYKEFVWIAFTGEPAAPSQGFSSYVFENGDALHLRFSAGPGDGGFFVDYDVLSGSGSYDGATGTGKLALVPTEWDEAVLFEGSIDVTTP